MILHLALEGLVYGEYSWEVFGYCQELEFSILFLLLPYLLLIVNMGFFILCSKTNPGKTTCRIIMVKQWRVGLLLALMALEGD